MTSDAAALTRLRTGGPQDDDDQGPRLFEQAMGWALVIALAMLVTQAGLL